MPVFPDRKMFRIHDPEVQPDSYGAPLPPIGVLVSASREQFWIGSLQQDVDVRLVLEEWDGQPLLPDAWDEEAKARLYLRGGLSVDMGSAGPAVSGLRLSGGATTISPRCSPSPGRPSPGRSSPGTRKTPCSPAILSYARGGEP
jgi:hypothetical protein